MTLWLWLRSLFLLWRCRFRRCRCTGSATDTISKSAPDRHWHCNPRNPIVPAGHGQPPVLWHIGLPRVVFPIPSNCSQHRLSDFDVPFDISQSETRLSHNQYPNATDVSIPWYTHTSATDLVVSSVVDTNVTGDSRVVGIVIYDPVSFAPLGLGRRDDSTPVPVAVVAVVIPPDCRCCHCLRDQCRHRWFPTPSPCHSEGRHQSLRRNIQGYWKDPVSFYSESMGSRGGGSTMIVVVRDSIVRRPVLIICNLVQQMEVVAWWWWLPLAQMFSFVVARREVWSVVPNEP